MIYISTPETRADLRQQRKAEKQADRKARFEARVARARERRLIREEAESQVTPQERKPREAGSSLPFDRQQGGFWLFATTPEQLAENNALLVARVDALRRNNGYAEPDKPYEEEKTLDDLELLKKLWPLDKDLSDAALDYDPTETQLGSDPEYGLP
jgi:hypothetical protein